MTLDEIKKHLLQTRNLTFLKEKTDNVSNKLYLFGENGTPTYVLKGLLPNDFEIEAYTKYLPRVANNFETLVIPELAEQFNGDDRTYLLLPYYSGITFDFNTKDINLANQLVDIVDELLSIDVESVITGGSNFDFQTFEAGFWNFFDQAIKIRLIDGSEKQVCATILEKGRTIQKMVIINGDFNPRNVIRIENNQIVLIDWNGIVFPLEHLLTYPWLLNWQNPHWQNQYASKFENDLPINIDNVRMHLMNIALQRAVGEKGHGTPYADAMAQNHIKNFFASLKGFKSLLEISG